jgi:hypothetical protein
MSWNKMNPDELQWQRVGEGDEKLLTAEPRVLRQKRLSGKVSIECDKDAGALLLLVAGRLGLENGKVLQTDDLLWIPAGKVVVGECPEALIFFELSIPTPLGPAIVTTIEKDGFSWQNFDDPAGRPTQPVQVLMEGGLSVLRTRFKPDFTAADHWHDFDTWYFITGGSMRFGHEGIYSKGEVRQVSGGYSYGPEEPEEDGVEFVLVSVGGPVALHWADLEKAPNGRL